MRHDAVFKCLYSACVFTPCSVTMDSQCALSIQSWMIGRCYEHITSHTQTTTHEKYGAVQFSLNTKPNIVWKSMTGKCKISRRIRTTFIFFIIIIFFFFFFFFFSSSPSIGTTAHCGLWPVEQCPFIFSYLPPTLFIFSLQALEDLFLLSLSIFSWVFPFFSSLTVLA